MPQLQAWLSRTSSSDEGTFGHLYCGDIHFHTGELPWRDNARDISCIPVGTYQVKYEPTGKHKGYVIKDVTGRTNIEIHVGNFCGDTLRDYRSDVEGCVILGCGRDRLNRAQDKPQEAVTRSRVAIERFHAAMQERPFTLHIVDKVQEASNV